MRKHVPEFVLAAFWDRSLLTLHSGFLSRKLVLLRAFLDGGKQFLVCRVLVRDEH